MGKEKSKRLKMGKRLKMQKEREEEGEAQKNFKNLNKKQQRK